MPLLESTNPYTADGVRKKDIAEVAEIINGCNVIPLGDDTIEMTGFHYGLLIPEIPVSHKYEGSGYLLAIQFSFHLSLRQAYGHPNQTDIMTLAEEIVNMAATLSSTDYSAIVSCFEAGYSISEAGTMAPYALTPARLNPVNWVATDDLPMANRLLSGIKSFKALIEKHEAYVHERMQDFYPDKEDRVRLVLVSEELADNIKISMEDVQDGFFIRRVQVPGKDSLEENKERKIEPMVQKTIDECIAE